MTSETGSSPHKQSLRDALRRRRDGLDVRHAALLSAQAQAHLTQLPVFQRALSIALFAAKDREVATDEIARAAQTRGQLVVFPRVVGPSQPLAFHTVDDLSTLVPGRFGLREPDPERHPLVELSGVELFVVPGLAFDHHGGRLGWGFGYYDRTLAEALRRAADKRRPRPTLVGLGYDFQVVNEVPMEPDDVHLDWLVTSSGAVKCDTPYTSNPERNPETETEPGSEPQEGRSA